MKLSDRLVQELRDQASRGATVPELLRLLVRLAGPEAAYNSTLVMYFKEAFALPARALTPIGGWSPDFPGDMPDERIQELIYPELMRTKGSWMRPDAAESSR